MNEDFQPETVFCPTCQGELIICDVLMYPGEGFSWELLDEAVIKERDEDPDTEWIEIVACPQCNYMYENIEPEAYGEQQEQE